MVSIYYNNIGNIIIKKLIPILNNLRRHRWAYTKIIPSRFFVLLLTIGYDKNKKTQE